VSEPLVAASHFDVCGPLPPPGVTVLEASAGTGKTFTIAGLVTRVVAEGLAPLSQILVVTFTRMATGQLRQRARNRMVTAEVGLGLYVDRGQQPPAEDSVLCLLAADGPETARQRRHRLGQALSNFDAATITTTHGFCHTVLAALGVWGDVAPGATLLESPDEVVEEVVDDLLARYVLRHGKLPFRRREALLAGLEAVRNPGIPLGPPADSVDPTAAGLQRRLAQAVRQEVAGRVRSLNQLTYDDVLVRLAGALGDPDRGPAACRRLRDRYRVVLVDEFQDTDHVQWEVVRQAFVAPVGKAPAHDDPRVVLVGDPKQAVYAFRGADVHSYLDAARAAGPEHHFTLEENWRTDAALLATYDALFDPARLGHPEIVYRRVRATPPHQRPGLTGFPVSAPLRARLVRREAHGLVRTSTRLVQKASALSWIAADLAGDVAALLTSAAQLVTWAGDQGEHRPVRPSDVGVLVRTNRQAVVVESALRALDVPVAVAGAQSVLATEAAGDWLKLLEALEQPAARSKAVAVALTPFLELTAPGLAVADEETWESLHARLYLWAGLLRREGTASLFGYISASEGLPARLLADSDGERRLTDLAHVAEVLHGEALRAQLGPAALRSWLAQRTEEGGNEGAEADQRARRLGSGADAVQVMTVHRAKGLEFPVVYYPYLWDPAPADRFGAPVLYHDPEDGERRKLDVGGQNDDAVYRHHYDLGQQERRGEDLRHLYVALTRARHQAVIWWAAVQGCQNSALGRLLLVKGGAGDIPPAGRSREPRDSEVFGRLEAIAEAVPGLMTIEDAAPGPGSCATLARHQGDAPLTAASFPRNLDLEWRRSSYSSLTAATHQAGNRSAALVSSEPEGAGTVDELPVAGSSASPDRIERPSPAVLARATAASGRPEDEAFLAAVPSLLDQMPAGPEVGTFVHSVLEAVDFTSLDLHRDLGTAISRLRPGYLGTSVGTSVGTDMLAAGLAAALVTPLGPLAHGSRLCDVDRRDRLDELGFELPLAGGDRPTGEVLMAQIAHLLSRHLPSGGPLGQYPAALAGPDMAARLRGYLTGSLDLVFRQGGTTSEARYFVVDYKTNRLAPTGDALTAWHYRPAALEAEMRSSHYVLQAVFYLVALHRYLRWRVAAYDPERHLGGALYLFVRGMTGPEAPPGTGVFGWRPPTELVVELSDLFAGPSSAPGPRP
jgi:exodeoxyribonuclease V beta subunit